MDERQRAQRAESANAECYDGYYHKPWWWFRFRYDTQFKRQTCLYLLRRAGGSTRGRRVLELGFGSGATLWSFDRASSVFGLEISRSAITRAEARAERLGYRQFEFREVAGSTLPYEDQSMDVVIASHVLEHVPDDGAMLREMRRVLRPEGVAIVLVPINENYDDPNHVRHYDGPSLIVRSREAGLRVAVELENERLYHLVERFYFGAYNKRWRLLGPVIVALFNVPTAILPFAVHRVIDRVLAAFGLRPRQAGLALVRAGNGKSGTGPDVPV